MNIPRIDLMNLTGEPTSFARIAKEAGQVASDTGFLLLRNAMPDVQVSRAFELAESFFALPAREKMHLARMQFVPENPNRYRGYFPVIANDPSRKEGFEFGRCQTPDPDFPEDTPWPEIQGFREHMEEMHLSLSRVGRFVLDLLGTYLQNVAPKLYDHSLFADGFNDGMSTFRLIHYPAVDGTTAASIHGESHEEGRFSTPDHTDSGFVTLLIQDQTGGLEALGPDGNWFAIEPEPGTIVMNLGDILQAMSGGLLKATRHRVRAPDRSRISMPFFFEPEPDKKIPYPYDDSGAPRNHPVRYADFLRIKIQSFAEYAGLGT
jgi:isopenicillin N synthase-like dioxygenase